MENNESEETIYQTLWDVAKAVPRGEFVAIQAHINKQQRSQTSCLTTQLNPTEKEQRRDPKINSGKETAKIRVENNGTEARKVIQRIMDTQSWFSKRINKID